MHNEVTYKLINNKNGDTLTLVNDPKNWDASKPKLKRSTKTYGVTTEYADNLEFTFEGKDFLDGAFLVWDVQADVTLQRWKQHPTEDGLYLEYSLDVDFSGYNPNDLVTKVKFKSGDLDALLDAQMKEKFELERLTSINGNTINPLNTVTVAKTSRDIFLLSVLKAENESVRIFSDTISDDETLSFRQPFPVKIISNSDQENIAQPIETLGSIQSIKGPGETSEMFYLIADTDKEDVRINIEFSFKIGEDSDFAGVVDNKNFYVRLKRFANGNTFDFVENIQTFISIEDNILTHKGETYSYSGEIIIDIATDESLSLVAESTSDYSNDPFGVLWIDVEEINCTITVADDTVYENTQTKAVLYHDAGDKLMQIITGEQNRYYSSFFGRTDLGYLENGTHSYTALALGLWIRQFNDYNIEMSLNDFLEAAHCTLATGYTIETINGVETLVHEDLKYFFQDASVIDLGEVTDLDIKVAKEFYNSSLTFGYKKPDGDNLYEEAMGLDEYNTQTSFTTPIDRVDTKYEKISPFRTDSYGATFAALKSNLTHPEQDTRYDKNIFMLDLKTGLGSNLEERTWQDDYEQEPTGVYSPETATNLRFSPSEMERRHQWFYGSCLYKNYFQDQYIRYANSKTNSELTTKKSGESERAENDNVLVSTIEKSRIIPMWLTFECEMTYEINRALYGKTVVNGREIPNYFFKVKFTHKGKKYKGYMFEVELKDKSKWKLLMAA